jgi:uncharacterized protein (DUF488 family)
MAAVGECGEILTVGHSNHELEDFLVLLRGAAVELLADVRRHPGSRRLPHFERSALAGAIAEAGIGYVWLGESLGGRRRPTPDSANDGWQSEQFRGYADHMATREFAAGLRELEHLAGERRTAVMCAEGWWVRCHRRLIADALLARGWSVLHLGASGRTEAHRLTEFAVLRGEEVDYPAPQTSLGL